MPPSFAERLKALREHLGFTQQELADCAGLHRMGIAKLEAGTREPTLATVQAICRALRTDCTFFFDDTLTLEEFGRRSAKQAHADVDQAGRSGRSEAKKPRRNKSGR